MRLYKYFHQNRDVQEVLKSKVFVDIILHFGWRGRENLKISDLWMKADSDGLRYVHINWNELTKNNHIDTNTAKN